MRKQKRKGLISGCWVALAGINGLKEPVANRRTEEQIGDMQRVIVGKEFIPARTLITPRCLVSYRARLCIHRGAKRRRCFQRIFGGRHRAKRRHPAKRRYRLVGCKMAPALFRLAHGSGAGRPGRARQPVDVWDCASYPTTHLDTEGYKEVTTRRTQNHKINT